MTVVITIVIILVLVVSIWLFIDWSAHLEMNLRYKKYLNYKEFLELHSKVDWQDLEYSERHYFTFGGQALSRFNNKSSSKLHANIVQFDGRKYRLYPLTLLRVRYLLKKEQRYD